MQNLILVWGIITSFLFPINNDKVNLLLLGKNEQLTDTMILASIDTDKKKISTVSIPRDLWIPSLKTKINSTYFYGQEDLTKKTVGEVFDTQINYSVLIDFAGFKNIIDSVGGIEVDVSNEFTDQQYPIAGKEDDKCIPCRYETITFSKGKQLMNGDTALKFVRSRHAEGLEGTDIAREARQQKVIEAIKNKFNDRKTYLSIKRDIEIYKAVRSSVKIDFDEKTASLIARKMFDSRNNIVSLVIPEDLLIVPKNKVPYQNQYVFIPKLGNGKWSNLQKWYKSLH